MRGVARPVLAAGLSGACWAELGWCGEDRPCEREGRRRRAGPLRKGCRAAGWVWVWLGFCFSFSFVFQTTQTYLNSNEFEFKLLCTQTK